MQPVAQPRGLFIPLNDDSGELLDAIANGAIAAIWERDETSTQVYT